MGEDEHETRAGRILDSVTLLIWTAQPSGQARFMNRCLRDYLGMTGQERTANWLELVHPDDRAGLEREWLACSARGADLRHECRLRKHDQTFHCFDVRGRPGPDTRDRMEWTFTGASVDGAHGLHARLRADQERLNSIMASSPGVVLSYHLGDDGLPVVSFVSAASKAVCGYTPEEIMAEPHKVMQRLNANDAAAAARATADSLRTGQPWHGQARYQHPTEGEKWLEPHFAPARDPDGRATWNGLVLDITSRRRDARQLKLVQTQLEAAIEAAQLGVWAIDLEKNLVWGNERQRELWGIADDVPAWYAFEHVRPMIHPDDLVRVDREMQRAILTSEPLEMEFRLRKSDGSVRWLVMRSQADCHPDGRPHRLMGINMDVTQRKQLAEAAMRSQKLEALGTLAGGIAHDFNNVLFAIAGNAALGLDAVAKDSEAHRVLQEIADASGRAGELVRQILTFSRPQDQKLEALDLAGPLQEAVRLLRATLPSGMTIQVELDPQTPPVLADASHMVQVVLNLCTNAAHAIGKANVGAIELRLSPVEMDGSARELGRPSMPRGSYALLSVTDNGSGMDDKTQARIFDPFFTTKAPGEGSGLGLSMVHGVVTALHGAVDVSSQIGKGSTFYLYLPAASRASPAPKPAATRTLGRGQQIMLVDDERMIVELGRAMLIALGYRPATFQRPDDALAAFRQEPRRYAAVVTDLSMPFMSGFELAGELFAIRRDVPVLVMSGNIGPDERAAAARVGVREIVLKPVSMERLSALLAELCGES